MKMTENFDCPHCGQDLRLPPNAYKILKMVDALFPKAKEGEPAAFVKHDDTHAFLPGAAVLDLMNEMAKAEPDFL
jgi:hypothetical protein